MTGAIREAYDIIKDKERWTKGSYARDVAGFSMAPTKGAARYCAAGALYACGFGSLSSVSKIAAELFPQSAAYVAGNEADSMGGSLVWVNDNLGHDAVVQVFEKAIVEEEGSL